MFNTSWKIRNIVPRTYVIEQRNREEMLELIMKTNCIRQIEQS